MVLLTLVPVAVYEYFFGVFHSDRYFLGKFCMCLWAPIGIVFALFCILAKVIRDPIMKRVLKSKVSDGRLRLSYGDERDAFEGSSLSNFEDERIHKSVERYNLRSRAWDLENDVVVDGELDDQISVGAQSEQTDDEDNFNTRTNTALIKRVNSASSVSSSSKLKKKNQEPGPYNYNIRTLMTYSKATVYTGKNIRIQPYSPFLQLANIGGMDSVHSVLTGGAMDGTGEMKDDNTSFMRRTNQAVKDVTEWNAPMTPGSVGQSNDGKQSTEGLGGVLLLTNGQISHYQPGLTTVKDVHNMASNANEDDFPSVKNTQAMNNIYSDDKQDRRLIDYPSIYFVPFKFAPVFTSTERKEIFKWVIPEAFVDDFTMSVRDVEAYLAVMRGKLEDIDKKQDTHLPAIWKKLNESNDW